MSVEQDDTNQHGRELPTATPPAPSYEPPAIAWDEPFAVTVALTCLFQSQLTCVEIPMGPGG